MDKPKLKINRESPIYKNALSLAKEHRILKDELTKRRVSLGLSQQELADKMGYTLDWVSRFERYDYDPTLSEVRRYALSLGVVIEHDVVPVRNPTDDGQH